ESEFWAIWGNDEPTGYRQYLTAFDLETGKPIRRRPPHQGAFVDRIGLSPDANVLLAVEEKTLRLRDPNSWELVRSVDLAGSLRNRWGKSGPAMAFAANAGLVAVACDYNTSLCIVDFKKPKLIDIFDVAEDYCVRLLSFSPDSKFLAIASYDVQKN